VLRGLQRVRIGLHVAPMFEAIAAKVKDGLPDDYQPVPKEEWISIRENETAKDAERPKNGRNSTTNGDQPAHSAAQRDASGER
jgi:hypothetical protein